MTKTSNYKFTPATSAIYKSTHKKKWFVFQDYQLLVKIGNNQVILPYVSDLSELGIKPVRAQYLGTLDGHSCFSAELPQQFTCPDDWTLENFRTLFMNDDEMFAIAGRAFQMMRWDQTTQYCGRCGAKTSHKEDEYAKICPQCRFISYPRISPAIIVAIVKNDKILLARAHRFRRSMYSVLAGFVDPGETLEQCIQREVKEEVGIEVKNIKYFASQPWPFPDSLMIAFTAEYANGEITIDESELADAQWLTVDQFPDLPDRVSIASKLINWFVESQK